MSVEAEIHVETDYSECDKMGSLNIGPSAFRLGAFDDNPDTSGWGEAQVGCLWMNRKTHRIIYWDGQRIRSIASLD